MHLLTSNFNLLHSNSSWNYLKKKFKFVIDENFNNFFLALNNKKNLKKFDTFHVIVNIDNLNKNEVLKKFKYLQKTIKSFNNKIFFFYIINELNKSQSSTKKLLRISSKLIPALRLNKNKNLFIKVFNTREKYYHNLRNKKFLKFPYDVDSIKVFSSFISSNIKIYNSKPYKLIILDCDNTLWGGILDEDGSKGIIYSNDYKGSIYKNFQKYLKKLKENGFLLTIASKNDEKKVWNVMRIKKMILQKKDFLSSKINWLEKDLNIKKILSNLGLRSEDSLFIDDNILEIKKVKYSIKNINTIHFDKPDNIFDKLNNDVRLKKFQVLKEDKKKYKQYKLKSKFEEYKEKEKNSSGLLKNLKQKIKIVKCNKKNFNRALQLFNKTNQFNFTLNRYKSVNLSKIIKDRNYTLRLIDFKDKFGNHGLIGSYVIKKEKKDLRIIDFLLSCRVLYRYIEDYTICKIIMKNKMKKILINYKPSNLNNKLVPIFLKKSFFDLEHKSQNNFVYNIKETKELNETKKYFNQ